MPSDEGEIVREIVAEWLEVGLETLKPDVSYGLTELGIRDEDHYRQLHRLA